MNPNHGQISAVVSGGRPYWTVVIPTHNCANYLRETLNSVLMQDPGTDQMEIIVVDDCSTKDDPQVVVREIAGDRVRFIQQKKNVGKARNYETGIAASRGMVIHQLHGDDRICDGFYESMRRCLNEFPDAGAVFCESTYIDANGEAVGTTGKESESTQQLANWLPRIYTAQRIQTPSIVVRRHVYEELGTFDDRLPYFEDWEMWIRIATRFAFVFNADATAEYRVYPNNSSSRSVLSGKRPRVVRQMAGIVDEYMPSEVVAGYKADRDKGLAYYFVNCMPATVKARSVKAWFRLVSAALSRHIRPRLLYYIFRFTVCYRRYI